MAALPSRHPYTVGLSQGQVERILRGWVEELGVPLRFGVDVIGLGQDDSGVDVHLADGSELRTSYLVGADGGRSVVRKAVGIELVGAPATRSHLIAEGELSNQPPTGIRHDDVGIHGINLVEGSTFGMVVTERRLVHGAEPTLADLSAALTDVYGTDFGIHDLSWISRFTDATLQATDYRRGRVLIAGDAAHVHPPTGGQGIGLGVQDAVNLGWKLAQVAHGVSPASLLDTYVAERHPATSRVLRNVMTQALLQRGDARTEAVRETFTAVLGSDVPRTQLAGLLSGLDVAYDLGGDHPLVGRRVPDLDLVTPAGPRRVFELLHEARPVLLNLGALDHLGASRWADRVRQVDATCSASWVLPVIGTVAAPSAVLIRPDGHVAWVGDGTAAGLDDALTAWCGLPAG